MKNIFGILIIAFSIFSCDNVECPNEGGCEQPDCFLKGTIITKESDISINRRILLLEFTGFQCTNCPEGAAEIVNLQNKMGDTLVPISVHSGFYAIPSPPKYTTDFRTNAGDEYENKFLPIGYPTAVINMKKFTNKLQQGRSDWETYIKQEIADTLINTPSIKLTSSYSEESKAIITSAKVNFKDDTDIKYNIIFLLIEDNIIDVQLNGSVYQTDYNHRHVLRSGFGKPLGEKVNIESITKGDELVVESQCLKLDPKWVVDNMEIISVLYNSENLEVVQVQTVHVK